MTRLREARARFRALSARSRGVLAIVGLVLLMGGGNLAWTSISVNSAQGAQRQALITAQASQRSAIRAAIAASNRQWCDSLDLLTSGGKPPQTQPGIIRLDDQFQTLERKFGCDGPKP